MTRQIEPCPKCEGRHVKVNEYQAECRSCGWTVQDPDPRYLGYVAKMGGWGRVSYEEPILRSFDELPDDFGAQLTTTRSALPTDHPVNRPGPGRAPAGAEFRMLRESLGLSAEWLADQLGVALKTVQRWEAGHRPIPDGVINQLDTAFYAMRYSAAQPCADQLIATPDPVMRIPRTGIYLGFPASWYRALVEHVRDILADEYADERVDFRVVYFDEVEEQQ